MSQQAIGIFDSGIGGLTVANAISKHLPNETLIYFGDTAHLPYGDKSNRLIKFYSDKITSFLLNEKNCKAIVIACNTASAAAYEYLRDHYKGIVPIINVIDPIVEALCREDDLSNIGLIATSTTIQSGVYQEKINRRIPHANVKALATPLLAPMIEEGYANDSISHTLISNYLTRKEINTIDALILGCTHYPLIKNEIDTFYQSKVKLFDSTTIVAEKLKYVLTNENLLAHEKLATNHFYISDNNTYFNKSAQRFFEESINLETLNIWDEN